MNISDDVESCKYLYLRELSEPQDLSLRIVLEEAKPNSPIADIEINRVAVSGRRLIESDLTCRLFELTWRSYVSYCVRNELFSRMIDGDVWQGRLFRTYSKSQFLDHVRRATVACDNYPGPLQHWGISCLNHVIDVVSANEPLVRRIRPL
jgi:hypothetical protein